MKVYDILILVLASIPLMLQLFKPITTEESILIMGLMIVIGLLSSGWSYLKERFDLIDENRQKINKLHDRINLMKYFHEIDKRLSLVEETNRKKKGQINPQVLIIIVLLILLYLFLRSAGYI